MEIYPHDPALQVPGPPQRDRWAKLKKALGPLAGVAIIVVKFFAKLKFFILPLLKFLPIILKSGGTMLLSIWAYAMVFGWVFAAGFVFLLLVHECGHLIVAKKFGLPVSAPVFIPFMGAFILLKDQPSDAWMEACVGIGGPILGSLGAVACHLLGESLQSPLLTVLALSGYTLNLFNLTPVGMLDGGRIVSAMWRWLWIPGFALLIWFGYTHPNLIVWIMVIASFPRIISLFRKRTEEDRRYYEVPLQRRLTMSILYFGLAAMLIFGTKLAHRDLDKYGTPAPRRTQEPIVQ